MNAIEIGDAKHAGPTRIPIFVTMKSYHPIILREV